MHIRNLAILAMAILFPLSAAQASEYKEGGIYDAADARSTSWNSVSWHIDADDPDAFTVAFGQTERDDAAVRALEFFPDGTFSFTDVPSTNADISWPGVAICVVGGVIACILFYPSDAKGKPDPEGLALGLSTLELDPVQQERLHKALLEMGVPATTDIYDIYDALSERRVR